MIEFLDYLGDLFKLIGKGIENFVRFILDLPNIIYALLDVIPEPFNTVLLYFISIIIFLIVAFAISRIVSLVKGG